MKIKLTQEEVDAIIARYTTSEGEEEAKKVAGPWEDFTRTLMKNSQFRAITTRLVSTVLVDGDFKTALAYTVIAAAIGAEVAVTNQAKLELQPV
jgi:hypothetical protein